METRRYRETRNISLCALWVNHVRLSELLAHIGPVASRWRIRDGQGSVAIFIALTRPVHLGGPAPRAIKGR